MNIRNILLVDDDPVDRRLVKMFLAKSGPLGQFKVETAGTLPKAIKCLNSGNYDLVLLDVNLPDSRGIDTVQKAHDTNSDIPILKIGNDLTVAMVDPSDVFAIDELRMKTGLSIEPALAAETEVKKVPDQHYGAKGTLEEVIESLDRIEAR